MVSKTRSRWALAVGMALVCGAGSPAWAQKQLADNPDQNSQTLEEQLQQLLMERVQTAELCVDAMQAAFDAETVTLSDLIEAFNKLAEARLGLATTHAQQIDALEKLVASMKVTEEKIRGLYMAGARGGEVKEYALVKRERQSAEIALLKAKIKAKP